jgi:hypothetical protein
VRPARPLAFAAVAALLAASVAAFAAPPAPTSPLVPDHGRFRILLNGRAVGAEEFTLTRQAGGWSARSQIELNLPGQPAEKDTADLELAADGAPLRYHWIGKSKVQRSIGVEFRNRVAEVALRRPGAAPAVEAFSFPAGHVVLLDNNVYEHYALLARLYDWSTGGAQKFSVLIPQDQAPGTVTVESLGKRTIAGASLDLLEVKSPDLQVDLYVDGAHRLIRLRVPGSAAEVVRE